MQIGVTGGLALKLGGSAPVDLADLRAAHEAWLPEYMERSPA